MTLIIFSTKMDPCFFKFSPYVLLLILWMVLNSCTHVVNSEFDETSSSNINGNSDFVTNNNNNNGNNNNKNNNNNNDNKNNAIPAEDPLRLDLNPEALEKGSSATYESSKEKRFSEIFIEKNDTNNYVTGERNHNSSWWNDINKEITDLLSSSQICSEEQYKCFYNKTELNESIYNYGRKKECKCDSSCRIYGDCCVDKVATIPDYDINIANKMKCGILSLQASEGIYMIGECLPEMEGDIEETLCHQQVPDESYGLILDIPVLSLVTKYTYINYYCALCNNDADSLLHMDLTLKCHNENEEDLNITLNEFLQEAKYVPRERRYVRPFVPNELTLNSDEEIDDEDEESKLSFGMTQTGKYMKDTVYSLDSSLSSSPTIQSCEISVKQYDISSIDNYAKELKDSRICDSKTSKFCKEVCFDQVESCNASWPILSDFEKCQSYSLKFYDFSENKFYKNPHCAKCNFVSSMAGYSECPLDDPFVYPLSISPFSDLFHISNLTLRKCPNKNEILNPIDGRCSEITCGAGRSFRKGKCSFNENKSNVTQEPSMINSNCPTFAVSNFTLNDNGSVYVFGNKLYEKGDFEVFNDSVVLLCAQDNFYYKKYILLSSYVTVVALSISLFCLAFHITLYFCFSRLRTWHGKNLLRLCVSLFIAQFLFLTGTSATQNFGFCVFMAVCIHYFWLASFFWMNVLSFDVWRTFKTKFTHNSNSRKAFILYNLYSWGVPFIIVILSLTLDLVSENSQFKPYYAGIKIAERCWFNNNNGLLYFFLVPVGIIICENLIFFTLTSYNIYSQSKETRFAQVRSQTIKKLNDDSISEDEKKRIKEQENAANKTNKIRFALYLKLAILQGLTWVFGLLSMILNNPVLWILFTIINGLQGAYIVICFDFKKWIFLSIRKNISRILSHLMLCIRNNRNEFHKSSDNFSSKDDSCDSRLNNQEDKCQSSSDSKNGNFTENTSSNLTENTYL